MRSFHYKLVPITSTLKVSYMHHPHSSSTAPYSRPTTHLWVKRLGQDLQELLVAKEKEARKCLALDVEVVRQALLHALQHAVGLVEDVAVLGHRAEVQDVGSHAYAVDGGAPRAVHRLEPLGLQRQLVLDVLGVEDGLQVHPLPLHKQPDVYRLVHHAQHPLPPGWTRGTRKRAFETWAMVCGTSHIKQIVHEFKRNGYCNDVRCSNFVVDLIKGTKQ